MVGASDKRNVMPARAWVELDCRILAGTTEADVEATCRDRLGDGLALRAELARAAHLRELLPAGRTGPRRDPRVPRRRGCRRRAAAQPGHRLHRLGRTSARRPARRRTASRRSSPPRSTCSLAGYHNADERVHVDDLHASVRFHLHLAQAAARVRARDLGITVGSLAPGEHDAITDVAGVRVGHTTVIEGDARRTGVTVVVPHDGNVWADPRVRGVPPAQRQRRDDRPALDRGGRAAALPHRHHQHAQRRRRARRPGRPGGRSIGRRRRDLGAPRGRRDLGRRPQRRRRLPRHRGARAGGVPRRPAAGRSPRAPSAAAPG